MTVTDEMVEAAAKDHYFRFEGVEAYDLEGFKFIIPWEELGESHSTTYQRCIDVAKAALEVALSVQAKQEPIFSIKPLVWDGNYADIGFGKYETWVFEECDFWYFNVSAFAFMSTYSKDAINGGPFDNEEDARSHAQIAAQNDYERRMKERLHIGEMVETAQAKQEPIGWLWKKKDEPVTSGVYMNSSEMEFKKCEYRKSIHNKHTLNEFQRNVVEQSGEIYSNEWPKE